MIFGLQTASKTDVDKAVSAVAIRTDSLDTQMHEMDMKLSNISGQLVAKRLLAVP